jgi:hypothetical protein
MAIRLFGAVMVLMACQLSAQSFPVRNVWETVLLLASSTIIGTAGLSMLVLGWVRTR